MNLRDLIDDLKDFWNDGWEKKALIVMGVVVLIILVYAFNPFQAKSNLTGNNDSVVAPTTSIPTTAPNTDTVNSTNSTNTTGNTTFIINEDQAKKIALQGNTGYSASDPLQGTIVVNQTTVVVWVVPISKGSISKTVYVDVNTGKVINV